VIKKLLLILFIQAIVISAFAQDSSSSVTKTIEGKKTKAYVGANLGGSLGDTGLGLTYGHRLNENNILEFNYKTWSDRDVKGLEFSGAAKIIYNGQALGITNKYFFFNSFNIKGGFFYRKSTIDIPPGLDMFHKGALVSERTISDISAEFSFGNHWFGENWGFAIDWFGYTPTLVKLDEVPGFERPNLQVLNFTLSYSF
jgi:hypothetical protein